MYNSTKNFVWWHGFVEDVNDPLKMGRCRVRIFGIHTHDKKDIPTESLPWAVPMMPYNSATASGIGHSPTGILPGSWVVGFFRDGEEAQQPMILGSYGGINKLEGITSKIPWNGFNDPSGKLPKDSYVDEPDTNKLARNEDIENTIVQQKKNDLDENNPTALGGEWSEPPTPYAAQYPKNHVHESESGHIFEVDDTPNAERIHQYHKTGTFKEIHPDGSVVEKIIGNDFQIVRKNNNVSIYGNMNVNVGDTIKIYSGKNLDVQIGGNARIHVAGNSTIQTDGNYVHKINGTASIVSGGNLLLAAPRIDFNPAGFSPSSLSPGFTLNKSRSVASSPVPVEKTKFEFEDGTEFECEATRQIQCADGWKQAKDITENDEIVSLEQRIKNSIPLSTEDITNIKNTLKSLNFVPKEFNKMAEIFTAQGYGIKEITSLTEDFIGKNFNPTQITSICEDLLNQGFSQAEILSFTNILESYKLDNNDMQNFAEQLKSFSVGQENFSTMINDLSSQGLTKDKIKEFVLEINKRSFKEIESIASDFDVSSDVFPKITVKINSDEAIQKAQSIYNFPKQI